MPFCNSVVLNPLSTREESRRHAKTSCSVGKLRSERVGFEPETFDSIVLSKLHFTTFCCCLGANSNILFVSNCWATKMDENTKRKMFSDKKFHLSSRIFFSFFLFFFCFYFVAMELTCVIRRSGNVTASHFPDVERLSLVNYCWMLISKEIHFWITNLFNLDFCFAFKSRGDEF